MVFIALIRIVLRGVEMKFLQRLFSAHARFRSIFGPKKQNIQFKRWIYRIFYAVYLAWNLKNHKNSIIRLPVVRIQFWKKVVVELFCFRPNIYLSISTSWVRSSRNRDSFFISKFINLISRASDPRIRYW